MALDAVRHAQFALILMDVNMPVMDGIEATRHIRSAEALGELEGRRPIIAVTANVMREAVDSCLQAGMDAFLPKPFQRQQLLEMLDTWLASSADQRAPERDPANAAVDGAIDMARFHTALRPKRSR